MPICSLLSYMLLFVLENNNDHIIICTRAYIQGKYKKMLVNFAICLLVMFCQFGVTKKLEWEKLEVYCLVVNIEN